MTPTRVLIVARRTAATPKLIEHVRERARRSACEFTLVLPRPYWDPDTEEAAATLELALPLLEDAAGHRVRGIIGNADPYLAVCEALEEQRYDEIVISTLPQRVSHWLRRDLPSRVERLGLPVTVITAKSREQALTPV